MALIELVKQGGYLALWAIFLWQFLIIAKIGLIGAFVLLTVNKLSDIIVKTWGQK